MTFFFNLEQLEAKTKNDPKLLVETLELHFLNKTIPQNALAKVKPLKGILGGKSFLLNAAPLFADKTTDIIYKAQYIKLAGRRNHFEFKTYGIKYLDLSYFVDLNIDLIKYNPLLIINTNKIYFKYEE